MQPIERAILDKSRSGPCCFDDIVTDFPDVSWGELFIAVDCMSRDGRVSLLEAYRYAVTETKRYYDDQGRLQTEHAQLDDDGDKKGTAEPDMRASVIR